MIHIPFKDSGIICNSYDVKMSFVDNGTEFFSEIELSDSQKNKFVEFIKNHSRSTNIVSVAIPEANLQKASFGFTITFSHIVDIPRIGRSFSVDSYPIKRKEFYNG